MEGTESLSSIGASGTGVYSDSPVSPEVLMKRAATAILVSWIGLFLAKAIFNLHYGTPIKWVVRSAYTGPIPATVFFLLVMVALFGLPIGKGYEHLR